jgi:nucleotide-binding universal stress UspA family protein
MSKILAPTRGGEASYPNQDRVIALAKEKGAELYFLYITDISFLDRVSSPVLIDVEEELDEMGRFVLAMAQERASAQSVSAEAMVRRGHFKDVLNEVVAELGVDYLIVGSPATGDAFTTFEFLKDLAVEMANTHRIETIILAKGEIVYEHKAGGPEG